MSAEHSFPTETKSALMALIEQVRIPPRFNVDIDPAWLTASPIDEQSIAEFHELAQRWGVTQKVCDLLEYFCKSQHHNITLIASELGINRLPVKNALDRAATILKLQYVDKHRQLLDLSSPDYLDQIWLQAFTNLELIDIGADVAHALGAHFKVSFSLKDLVQLKWDDVTQAHRLGPARISKLTKPLSDRSLTFEMSCKNISKWTLATQWRPVPYPQRIGAQPCVIGSRTLPNGQREHLSTAPEHHGLMMKGIRMLSMPCIQDYQFVAQH